MEGIQKKNRGHILIILNGNISIEKDCQKACLSEMMIGNVSNYANCC